MDTQRVQAGTAVQARLGRSQAARHSTLAFVPQDVSASRRTSNGPSYVPAADAHGFTFPRPMHASVLPLHLMPSPSQFLVPAPSDSGQCTL